MDEFERWNKLKIKTHKRKNIKFYRDREIWWCRVGQNIGTEINGKSEEFTRPVLVLKSIHSNLLIGIPLTHTLREDSIYTSFYFKGDFHCVSLAQIRSFDARRFTFRIGRVSKIVQKKIIDKLKSLF